MENLKELYQEVILDHNKNPKNFGRMDSATHSSEGYNPLCGDRVNIYLRIEDNHIEDISFEGVGCAISKAAASLMTAELKGKTVEEAKEFFKKFQQMITSELDTTSPEFESLGKLGVLAGVREFPTRIKCASLAWHTMIEALEATAG